MGWRSAYMMKQSAVYITRCDIGWYSKNANAYLKPLEVASKYRTKLCVDKGCVVPREIEEKCERIVRFNGLWGLLKPRNTLNTRNDDLLFTGFDFPCMFKAWRLKKRLGCKWTVFLWDPPSLSHRDGFPPLRWAIDVVFRFFAKRCDKLILNIHPGLLGEIGYLPPKGQLELRVQDAWKGMDFNFATLPKGDNRGCFDYDFGVLADWKKEKGSELMAAALEKMPQRRCLWIGNVSDGCYHSQIKFTGKLPQKAAFCLLRRCRILVVPYFPTRALKWNFPLKLFEYLTLGRPILASDNQGNSEIAKRYPGRISLFKSGSVEDFCATSMRLFADINA